MYAIASQHPAWGTGRASRTVSCQPAPVGKGGERSRRQTGEWPSAGTGTLDAVSSGLCEHSLSWEAGVVWQGLGVERVVVERDVTSPWGL